MMRRLKPVVSFDSLLIVAETFSMRQVMYIAHLRLYIHSITLALALYIIMCSLGKYNLSATKSDH